MNSSQPPCLRTLHFPRSSGLLISVALSMLPCIQPLVQASSAVVAIPGALPFVIPNAQSVVSITPRNPFAGLSYASKASLLDLRMQHAVGYEARAQVARDYILSSPHAGARRLDRMFRNFDSGSRVDFKDLGLLKEIKRIGVENRQVAEGASRQVVYYQKLHNNPAFFREVRMSTPVPTARGGLSDMDVRYLDRSGKIVWVEIKNNRQLSLDARIQAQLERMGSFTGRRVLVCQGPVSPSVKQLAAQQGVEVFEKVRSQDLVATLARADIQAMKLTGGASMAGGVMLAGFGVYSAHTRLEAADWIIDDTVRRGLTSDALLTAAGVTTSARGAMLWHQASTATAGSARAGVSGAAHGAGTSASRGAAAGAAATGGGVVWTRALGAAGWVLVIGYAGNECYRLYVGDVDPRAGMVQLSGLGGSAALGLACGKGGAVIGLAVGGPLGAVIGGVVGGTIGGVGGYFGGRAVGDFGYDHFVFSNAEFAERKLAILKASLE